MGHGRPLTRRQVADFVDDIVLLRTKTARAYARLKALFSRAKPDTVSVARDERETRTAKAPSATRHRGAG
jgi:hypothetical protein